MPPENPRTMWSAFRELELLQQLPASNPLVLEAARLKGRHRVSYADAFAAVTAHREKASLVTGDPELKRLSETGFVPVDWVGR